MTATKPSKAVSPVADKLREARALIERGWTQGAFARDAWGRNADELCNGVHELVCFCAVGALRHVRAPLAEAVDVLGKAAGDPMVLTWNDADGRTQAEVLAAFDKAIELATQEVSQ